MSKIRTRFAPSPTGRMHVGNLRSALYEFLIAKHADGDFMLRIEDTDQERYVEGAVDIIYNTMAKTGLIHDEGPDKDGGFGPYVQSERMQTGIYMKYAKELIEKGEEFEILMEESEIAQNELMLEIAKKEKEYDKAKHAEWLATSVTTLPTVAPGAADPSVQPPSSGGWVSPIKKGSYWITSTFGMRVHPILGYARMHNGVDMACAQGTPIYAAKSGKVTTASYQAGGAGYYVSINHGDGFSSIYMHMTHFIVSPGQYVTAGQVIGYVGSTGGSTGPHLHFGISYNGTYVNPMDYI